MRARAAGLLAVLALGAGLLAGYGAMGPAGDAALCGAVLARGLRETGARNLVAAIYLDYRLFDTLLEALLLLVAVIGVSQFSRFSAPERTHGDVNRNPRQAGPSPILLGSLSRVYLLIALYGVYVVVTGMDGPGGGFQGGAILAAIVISAHFAQGRLLLPVPTAERLEKCMYILILLSGCCFLLFGAGWGIGQRRLYLLAMNLFIGAKVCAGLCILYLLFMSCSPRADEAGGRNTAKGGETCVRTGWS